jgi:hypothetical protein
MKKKVKKARKVSKWIYWTPRILSIIFILFLALFSLDIFDSCNGLLNCAGGLFMHNIPVIILAILLWISWKYEIVGAVTFILAGIVYIILTLFRAQFEWYRLFWILQISGPAFLVGILFWLNWIRKKR